MKTKIAMVFPYAPSYREPIYKLMDKEFDCTFFFCGNSNRGLKYMDYSHLKNVDQQLQEGTKGPFEFYHGISKIDFSDFDVVMHPGTIRNLSSWYMVLKLHLMRHRPKIAIWTHGWYGKENKVEVFLKRLYFRLMDRICVYGEYARKGLVSIGVPEAKITTIYNSLDYERQLLLRQSISKSDIYEEHFGNKHPVIIMIGRLNARKKLDMLIDAVAQLDKNGESYNLVFIGDGEDRINLEKLTDGYGLSQRVWFYGACFDERANSELLYNADLCIIPGDIGLTAIHAMTLGVPVISHNLFKYQGPEFEAIVPGVTGEFFIHDNLESLCSTISNWFKSKSIKREEVRSACYSEIDKHWNPHYQLNILKQVLDV